MKLRHAFLAALGAAFVAAAAPPARAADPAYITFGAGIWDLKRDDERTAEFRVEYRSNWELLWIIKPFGGAMLTPNGSFHAFGGLLADIKLPWNLVLTPNLAVGAYSQGGGNDLGHVVEFRDAIELAYQFENKAKLGLMLYHMSNANIGDKNPGIEVLSISLSIPLGSF
ncbi:MAG: acyloxyacyl hydrolase [Rhodospirillales bacterium]